MPRLPCLRRRPRVVLWFCLRFLRARYCSLDFLAAVRLRLRRAGVLRLRFTLICTAELMTFRSANLPRLGCLPLAWKLKLPGAL